MNNASQLAIQRPIATLLLTTALALLGLVALKGLPAAPLPQVDFPVISVNANLAGASPEVMASSVATPLEKALGQLAGVNEITSTSTLGKTSINIQFDLNRDIDGAARDVQAAIQAARSFLPSGMTSNPTYKKANPADAPIMVLSLTSDTLSRGQLFDMADTILAQRLAQIEGIGQVVVGGGASPAIRIQVDSQALAHYQLALEDVRTVISNQHTFSPLGTIEDEEVRYQLNSNQQLSQASDYAKLLLKSDDNAHQLRLADIAQVTQSVQDTRTFGYSRGKPAVVLILYRQPNANMIATVDRVYATLPSLQALVPSSVEFGVAIDRTPTVRASLKDVEETLIIAIFLVVFVVFAFTRTWHTTLIPALSIPVSLLGTLVVMAWLDFSLNNLSLMALIVATSFVVDDSIVVLENILRYREKGYSAYQASVVGTREISFTVIAISLSLVAVFIPLLFMGGLIGRLFTEFAVTLSVAVLISMVIALTTTPALAVKLLPSHSVKAKRRLSYHRWWRQAYKRSLAWSLRHPKTLLTLLIMVIVLNISLYVHVSKGFMPEQDTGRIMGRIQADQHISFEAMQGKLNQLLATIQADPAIDTATAFMGFGASNSAVVFISLKPKTERKESANDVINRLRPLTNRLPGARTMMFPVQDLRMGTQNPTASYNFSLKADSLETLREAEPRVLEALRAQASLKDVDSNQQSKGAQTYIHVDRNAAQQLGISMRDIDNTLNNAFAQRLIGTLYRPLNQYRIVLESEADERLSEANLASLFVLNNQGQAVALSRIARIESNSAPLAVYHEGGFPAYTISFNLAEKVSLTQGIEVIENAIAELALPASVQVVFGGNAKLFKSTQSNQLILIISALVCLYLILGILYESLLHPITILSTLPTAGLGGLIALELLGMELTIIALIGIFLLLGLVKKNAILMIDFALNQQRNHHHTAAQAIYIAAQVRFRPILMTTLAGILGAVPLAIGFGEGSELRVPLGVTLIGGLIVSQLLTLYTTPVVFLALERLKARLQGKRNIASNRLVSSSMIRES
ncbi:MAG: multidrug transporter subunit MdtC [Thiotrichales bacterium 34-46-19]|nr:MAG: multidrug transporter subunit MdtC [Thiotrichales bacterium 35-46-9]OZA19594.1 MAG: multidrug transporter subunit MdtC [Thiotrichales bacterium 17-46-47]OZA96993.1 MAG: multidrug transporter subunit MdtC [Thiotrichales bacterium 34-46-19]UCG19158.1 MAG: efflux RND transporter permease subunit [Thiotrichales bacterium]HQT04759.1 efflux RND transporter permease subunit [Thiotrichales bacterium]